MRDKIYGKEWEYRVMDDDGSYGFITVAIDEQGKIKSHYLNYGFDYPVGTSFKELELELERMAEALNKPVLSKEDICD